MIDWSRSQLANAKPGLWRKLSDELYRKNYRFPEMPQYRFGTEFPAEFVPPA